MKSSLHRMPDFPKNASESSIGRARLPNHPEPLSELESTLIVKFTMTPANAPTQEFPIGRSLGNGQTSRARTLAAGSCSARLRRIPALPGRSKICFHDLHPC